MEKQLQKQERDYQSYVGYVAKARNEGYYIRKLTKAEYLSQKNGIKAKLAEEGKPRNRNINRLIVENQKTPGVTVWWSQSWKTALTTEYNRRDALAWAEAIAKAETKVFVDEAHHARYIKREHNKIMEADRIIKLKDGLEIDIGKIRPHEIRHLGKENLVILSEKLGLKSLYHELRNNYEKEGMTRMEAREKAAKYISWRYFGSPE